MPKLAPWEESPHVNLANCDLNANAHFSSNIGACTYRQKMEWEAKTKNPNMDKAVAEFWRTDRSPANHT